MIKEIARIEIYKNHNGNVCSMTNIKDQSINQSLKDIIIQASLETNFMLVNSSLKKAPEGTGTSETGANHKTHHKNIIKRKDCQP